MNSSMKDLYEAIKSCSHGRAMDLFSSPQFQRDLKEEGWSLLSHFCEFLNTEVELMADNLPMIGAIVDKFIEYSSPKEILFSLLENCEAFKNNTLFLLLVPRLRYVLLSLPANQRSLDINLETLYGHICSMDWYEHGYVMTESADDEKVMTIEHEGAIASIVQSVIALGQFVDSLTVIAIETKDTAEQKLLLCCLLRLLNYPLLFFYLGDDEVVSKACNCVVQILTKMHPTITNMLLQYPVVEEQVFEPQLMIPEPIKWAISREIQDVKTTGFAHLLYLVLVKRMCMESMPQVFAPEFKLLLCLPYICNLWLRAADNIAAYKAVELLSDLVYNIPDCAFNEAILDMKHFKQIFTFLFWGMQHCTLLPLRRLCARQLPRCLNILSVHARFCVFNWFLETVTSSDVLSYVYTLIKDVAHKCWDDLMKSEHMQEKFLSLLGRIFKPPVGDDGSLVRDIDMISSALNLARYLVLRDKNRNSPCTRHMTSYLQQYIKPVGICLQKHEVELLDRMKVLNEPIKEPHIALSINDEEVCMSESIEKEAIKAALHKLELVRHVHSCLTDCLEGY